MQLVKHAGEGQNAAAEAPVRGHLVPYSPTTQIPVQANAQFELGSSPFAGNTVMTVSRRCSVLRSEKSRRRRTFLSVWSVLSVSSSPRTSGHPG